METTIILGLYKDYIGIMERKMETTMILGYIGVIQGVYRKLEFQPRALRLHQ